MSPETLRLPLDVTWAEELKGFLAAHLKDAPPPDLIEGQVDGVFLAGYCRDMGLIRYVEGAALDEVRTLLRRSCSYTLEVFNFRDADPEEADASLTNSRRGLQTMELALACGAPDLARTLASLVWDRPNASYLGPGSVVCTPEEQHLAYALRDALTDQGAGKGLQELRAFVPLTPEQDRRASLLTSFWNDDAAAFSGNLSNLHALHLARVENRGPLNKLDDLMDVLTLAYAALGATHFFDLNLPPVGPIPPSGVAAAGHGSSCVVP